MHHFTNLTSSFLFTLSVSNFYVAIYDLKKPGQRGILRRHSKLFLVLEIVFALGVPATIVSAILGTVSYQSDITQFICAPNSVNGQFYSYTVPTQVASVIAFIMAILIIKRMRQVYMYRNHCTT